MLTRRLLQLYSGLVLYGVSMALMIRADLGLDPWDVFHQGVAERVGWSFGTVTIVVGALVLLLWIPLRQRPGIGTVSNVVVIGLAVDAALRVLPTLTELPLRIAVMLGAVFLNAVATGAYIGAQFGPGPRDGLMTGFVRRTGGSLRVVRTAIEVTVLAVGWLLGGTAGIGTLVYAVSIGPLVHRLLPALTVPDVGRRPASTAQPAPVEAATSARVGLAACPDPLGE